MIHTNFGNRRGLSTIIGGFIFLILMVGAFTALILGFQINTELFEAQVNISSEEIEKSRETIDILTSSKPSEDDRLYVQVHNKGNTPIQVSDVWVINKSDSSYPPKRFEIEFEDSFVSPGSKKQILANTPVTLSDAIHDIKVVTELGTVVTQELQSPLNPLESNLFIIPAFINNGNNSTVAMLVTNRGNATVLDVQPDFVVSSMVDPSDALGDFSGPLPARVNLEPLESVMFKWNFQLFGAVGTTIDILQRATGIDSVTGDTVTSQTFDDEIKFVPSPKNLAQLPEIQMLVPAPFGHDNDDLAFWSVSISNPTPVDIEISRLVITARSALESPTVIFDNDCNFIAIEPTTGWSCPGTNTILWDDGGTPIDLKAFGTESFTIRIEPGKIGAGKDDNAYLVTTTILTSYGQTSRPGLISSMENSNTGVLANVYLTGNTTTTNPLTEFHASDVGIVGGTPNYAFNVTLADFSIDNSYIDEGTDLIINVPSGFKDITADCNIFSGCTTTTFPDGSTQIRGTLPSGVTIGEAGAEAATISFTTTIPVVTSNSVYVMFVLAEGDTSTGFPVGPVAEIPLQVLP